MSADDTTNLYDPEDHTVDEVAGYLATVDDDEVARVKEVEAAGKGRSTIAEWERPAPEDADGHTASADEDGRPVWNTSTHGKPPLGREGLYRVV